MSDKAPARPNIIFIVTDDQGNWALGAGGNTEIITPNLDALAEEGALLTSSVCASPVCSPARASLLTGRMPSAHGVHDWLRDTRNRRQEDPYLAGLSTTPSLLAASGYQCGISGKWHLGASQSPQQGFDFWFAHPGAGGPYGDVEMFQGERLVQTEGYLSTVITDRALDFLDSTQSSEDPFYLLVSYTAPHTPWLDEHPQDLLDLYADCHFASCPQEAPHPWRRPVGKDLERAIGDPRPSLQGMFASITGVDREIGRLLEWLRARDLEDNTIIVFTSDNGFSTGHHGFWGKGNGTWPLNGWDVSIKVPTIVRYPGGVQAGQRIDALVSGCDFHPTLLDFAGALPSDADPVLAGTSVRSLLTGAAAARRESVVVFDEYGGMRLVRTPRWKLIERFADGPEELYDLHDDPGETVNLATARRHREVKSDLAVQLYDFFREHSLPERDGYALPVFGTGQRRPVTMAGADATFHPQQ